MVDGPPPQGGGGGGDRKRPRRPRGGKRRGGGGGNGGGGAPAPGGVGGNGNEQRQQQQRRQQQNQAASVAVRFFSLLLFVRVARACLSLSACGLQRRERKRTGREREEKDCFFFCLFSFSMPRQKKQSIGRSKRVGVAFFAHFFFLPSSSLQN